MPLSASRKGAGKPPLHTSDANKSGSKASLYEPEGDWFSRIPWVTKLVIVYVTAALGADTLVATGVNWPFHWQELAWRPGTLHSSLDVAPWSRFDLFKFSFWFLVPFIACLPGMNWRYLVRGPWKRGDVAFVGALTILGMGAMFLIPLVPALKAIYPDMGDLSTVQKWDFFSSRMVWTLSWLIGWEFLHRYLLLGAAQKAWPKWGWVIVPLSETLYHLQKPGLEAVGMMAFSVVLTLWCMKRSNWLLGFLVHLIIEVELLIFMTMIA